IASQTSSTTASLIRYPLEPGRRTIQREKNSRLGTACFQRHNDIRYDERGIRPRLVEPAVAPLMMPNSRGVSCGGHTPYFSLLRGAHNHFGKFGERQINSNLATAKAPGAAIVCRDLVGIRLDLLWRAMPPLEHDCSVRKAKNTQPTSNSRRLFRLCR